MRDLCQPRDFNVRAAPYLGNGGLSRPAVNYQGPLLMLRHGSEWEEEERRRNQQIFQKTIAHISSSETSVFDLVRATYEQLKRTLATPELEQKSVSVR